MSTLRPLIVAALVAVPMFARAQPDQAAGPQQLPASPYGNPGYGYGYPPPYPAAPPGRMAPGSAPWGQGPWDGPSRPQGAYPVPGEPGQTSPPALESGRPFGPGAMTRSAPGQMRIAREMTDNGYLVRITVDDGKTAEVQVTPMGGGLAISRSSEAETVQEDTLGDGRGYRRSFSFSRGSFSRRLRLPPDADLAHMTREESEDTITLRIPRLPLGGAPGPDAGGTGSPATPPSPAPRQ